MPVDPLATAAASSLREYRWLARLKSLNETAWDDLIKRYGTDLRRDIAASMRKRGMVEDQVEDVEQETWRVAIQKIHEFDCDGLDKLYHWLRVIALNRVRMLKRKEKENQVSFEEIEAGEQQGGISLDYFLYLNDLMEGTPEEHFLLREQLVEVDRALTMLKPRDREILLRRMLEGESPGDLAEDYGLAPRSISMILLRSKQSLERHLTLQEGLKKGDDHA